MVEKHISSVPFLRTFLTHRTYAEMVHSLFVPVRKTPAAHPMTVKKQCPTHMKSFQQTSNTNV